MKKVNLPILLPVVLVTVIAVLTGVLLYNSYTNEQAPLPPTAQTPVATVAIDIDGVYADLRRGEQALSAVTVAQTNSLKGEYLLKTAQALEDMSRRCTEKEQSLAKFSAGTAEQLHPIGSKLKEDGELTEVDATNITSISKSVESARMAADKAVQESNGDYLRGDFPMAVIAETTPAPIAKEQADKSAKSVVAEATLISEEEGYYNFSTDKYMLQVDKDGLLQYRLLGYGESNSQLTEEGLSTLISKGKQILKDKGFGDMAIYRWQSGKGEIYLEYCPVLGDTVYLNRPFAVILSIDGGNLLGLRTQNVITVQGGDNPALLSKLEKTYTGANYIIKVINKHGSPCYQVSYAIDGKEYLSLWSSATQQELSLEKVTNTAYGRDIEPL